jgi:hypothetical protein
MKSLSLKTWAQKFAYLVKNDTINDKFDGANSCIMQPSKINSKVVQLPHFAFLGEGKVARFPNFSFIVLVSKNSNASQINWLLVKTLNILKMVSKLPRQMWSSSLWKNGS